MAIWTIIGAAIAVPFLCVPIIARRNEIDRIKDAEEEKRPEGKVLREILVRCYWALEKQRARGYGSWIPSCVDAIDAGRDCPPEVAVLALEKTAEELAGRVDTAPIIEAIEKIKGMGA